MKLNLGPSVLIYSVAKGATKVTCSCSIRAGIGILLWCCNYIENPQQPIKGRLRHVNSGSGLMKGFFFVGSECGALASEQGRAQNPGGRKLEPGCSSKPLKKLRLYS